ncbi:MAG: hypothetical protein AAE977_05785 [Thermoplasmataceae archaeon]|jgi:hypothetical protein
MSRSTLKLERLRSFETEQSRQELISAVFSALQSNYDEIHYIIERIDNDPSHNFTMTASMIGNSGKYVLRFYFAVAIEGKIPENDIRSFLDERIDPGLSSMDKIIVIPNETDMRSIDISDSIYNTVVWRVNRITWKIIKLAGTHFDSSLNMAMKNGLEFLDIFPLPYTEYMHPLLKYRIISLNYFYTGKHRIQDIISMATEYAYMNSVGIEKQRIRLDMTSLIRTMIRSGIVTSSGEFVHLSASPGLETKFLRRYYDFLEKSSKRTLFDYESLV